MRVAFSILYNAVHHLRHGNYGEKIVGMVDKWFVVEGAAGCRGSTSWCKDFHRPVQSTDGTRELLQELQGKYPDKVFISLAGRDMWPGKDQMVQHAMRMIIAQGIHECFLWEIDADEQWTSDQLSRAEKKLEERNAKTGTFYCDYYLSSDLLAQGEWGEGRGYAYRRLWRWAGEQFSSHEPPVLQGGNGTEILIGERFRHYAYFFEKDVHFKSQYYGGHENIYKPWLLLQMEAERRKLSFPLPISYIFGKNSHVGRTNTFIIQKP